MNRYVTRACAVAACALALAAASVGTATAGDGVASADAQILDVSKQVSSIQRKMDELIAHGQWARAGKLLASAECGYDDPTPVFEAWGDSANYSLAPQGDLSAAVGWSLNKQASIVSGADPFSGAGQSLQLAKGAEVATPAMCVNLDHPTIRFFVKDVGGNGKANLKVDVLYEDLNGHVKHLMVAKLKAGSEWQPSAIVPMYMNILAQAAAGGVTAVAFQFKAEGLQKDETVSISSIYVDPFQSR